MAGSAYKLSCSLFGHSLDVRSVDVTSNGDIVSGSRDKTTKLWSRNLLDVSFHEKQVFTGHDNFVSAVCFIPPSSKSPNGLIVSGSNDKAIAVYSLTKATPLKILKSHSDTVCKITPGLDGTILSSSWDKTSKLWDIETGRVLATYTGHQAAVWSSIQLANSLIITVSADKTIKVYEKSGSCLRTLSGHTDCVRDVTASNADQFLTCSNDATVRLWNSRSGACLGTFHGHTNFIYSISSFVENDVCTGFLTSSEDRTVRLWSCTGDEVQAISVPAHSVWSCKALPNGDIVTGSSDGIVRVFSAESARQAEPEILSAYDEQIKNMNITAGGTIGGVKVSDLPGLEGLALPGKTDGQTKLINNDGKVIAYSWSATEDQWNIVGDVMGSAPSNEAARPTFEDQEYDFVFNVDIEEGKPPLKLPFNKSDDPWHAAQNFLHKNNLSQHYLEQVANFIVVNSGQENQPTTGAVDFVDPFTGGARYVPEGSGRQANGVQGTNTDPFTGGASYNTNPNSNLSKYFPQRELLRFDQANLVLILEKLLNFNKRLGTCDENDIEDLIQICELNTSHNSNNLQTIAKLLKWPADCMFPVLDVLRLAIRNAGTNKILCTPQLLSILYKFVEPPSTAPNNMLALRVLSNMMTEATGFKLAEQSRLSLLKILTVIVAPFSKPLQVAMATLLLNISVVIRRSETNEGRHEALDVAETISDKLNDEEARFRWLVAVGTLLNDIGNTERLKYAEVFRELLLKVHGSYTSDRITECAFHVINILP